MANHFPIFHLEDTEKLQLKAHLSSVSDLERIYLVYLFKNFRTSLGF